ncbi:MAG: hypothetical protein V1857_07025 [archaeon]
MPFGVAQDVGALRSEIASQIPRKDSKLVLDDIVERFPVERYGAKRIVEELKDLIDRKIPVPSDKLILVEAFDRFLVIHACLGEAVTRTMTFIIDSILTNEGLIRNIWADGYRILVELARDSREVNLEQTVSQILMLPTADAERAFWQYVEKRRPFAYYMKPVAERFGSIPRGLFLGSEKKFQDLAQRFAATPIHEETMREALRSRVDLEETKRVYNRIQKGSISVKTLQLDRPTSLAYYMVSKFLEIPEMMAPESTRKENLERMKAALEAELASLFCMERGDWSGTIRVGELSERPCCPNCGSGLLALLNKSHGAANSILQKYFGNSALSKEERDALAKTRRTADLILSYGKRAVIALLTWGVGPRQQLRSWPECTETKGTSLQTS